MDVHDFLHCTMPSEFRIMKGSGIQNEKNKYFETIIHPKKVQVEIPRDFKKLWCEELEEQNYGWIVTNTGYKVVVDLLLSDEYSYLASGLLIAKELKLKKPTPVIMEYQIEDNRFMMHFIGTDIPDFSVQNNQLSESTTVDVATKSISTFDFIPTITVSNRVNQSAIHSQKEKLKSSLNSNVVVPESGSLLFNVQNDSCSPKSDREGTSKLKRGQVQINGAPNIPMTIDKDRESEKIRDINNIDSKRVKLSSLNGEKNKLNFSRKPTPVLPKTGSVLLSVKSESSSPCSSNECISKRKHIRPSKVRGNRHIVTPETVNNDRASQKLKNTKNIDYKRGKLSAMKNEKKKLKCSIKSDAVVPEIGSFLLNVKSEPWSPQAANEGTSKRKRGRSRKVEINSGTITPPSIQKNKVSESSKLRRSTRLNVLGNNFFETVVYPNKVRIEMPCSFKQRWYKQLKTQNYGWFVTKKGYRTVVDIHLHKEDSYLSSGFMIAKEFNWEEPTPLLLEYECKDNLFKMHFVKAEETELPIHSHPLPQFAQMDVDRNPNDEPEFNPVIGESEIEAFNRIDFERDTAYKWEKIINLTFANSKTVPGLNIPRPFSVAALGNTSSIVLQSSESDELTKCKVLTSKRSKDAGTFNEKTLSEGWIGFMRKNNIEAKDKLTFRLARPPVGLHVQIHRFNARK